MKLRIWMITAVFLVLGLTATNGYADNIQVGFNLYADDYGKFTLDGTLLGTYDNPAAAGNIIASLNLAPGWHSISIDYANRIGTNFLGLSWELPGATTWSTVPLADLRSFDKGGSSLISGLRADYYDSLGGSFLFSVYGEGPICNGATSFTNEIYECQPGLWAGVFGPSADFEERLSGEIFVPGATTPEPDTLSLLFCALFFSTLGRLVLRKAHAVPRLL